MFTALNTAEKGAGLLPVLYGIGLQLIWVFEGSLPIVPPLDATVDKIDNQRSIIQSVFVVDLSAGSYQSARTRGQFITGKFQDANENRIKSALTVK